MVRDEDFPWSRRRASLRPEAVGNEFPTDRNAAVSASPALSTATSTLFIAGEDGKVYALDSSTGAVLGTPFDVQADLNSDTATIRSSPAIIAGKLFIVAGDDDGRYLYCFGD